MTPSPSPTPFVVVIQNPHDLYDVMKDIVLPSLGIAATIFVGIVAVVVSLRLGKRAEAREDRSQRIRFASVADAYLRGESTESKLQRASAIADGDEAEALAEFAVGAREYEVFLRDLGFERDADNVIRTARAFVHQWRRYPSRALNMMEKTMSEDWLRWVRPSPNGTGWVWDDTGEPAKPEESRWRRPGIRSGDESLR